MKLNKEISVGNILTIVTILMSFLGSFISFDRRLTVLETKFELMLNKSMIGQHVTKLPNDEILK